MTILQEVAEKFIAWTKLKIRVHHLQKSPYFYEREIWWCHLGCNVGYEENGKNDNFERPVIVLRKFNQHFFWSLPTSTKLKEDDFYYTFTFEGERYSALLSQMRPISSRRLIRKIGMVNEQDFKSMRKKIAELIKNDSRTNE